MISLGSELRYQMYDCNTLVPNHHFHDFAENKIPDRLLTDSDKQEAVPVSLG